LVSYKFKRGDIVIVDEGGEPMIFEIISPLQAGKGRGLGEDLIYDARKVSTGEKSNISEDEILRLATPVDNSAQLFRKRDK
jgi:hypothetical protein